MIISESQLYQSFSQSYVSINEERTRTKNARESFNQGKSKNKPIVFLSHKHDELKLLEQTINLIKSCGVDVYIDWMDEGMPKKTCSKTAERIKDKIEKSDKFILVGTEGAINSKWCNWELGIGDVRKHEDANLAILPIKRNYSDYSGNEYIELYPTIQYEDGSSYHVLMQEIDGCITYVLQFGNKPAKGRIPKGYYVQIQDDHSEEIIKVLIKLEDWLRSK
ncbi:MAG: toll/interleukin-1 receptor domain-containing protein [Paludibacter sp.]|nr:toll/interleukin-1 receptor domain-containing protein [Paludibacter sp.]